MALDNKRIERVEFIALLLALGAVLFVYVYFTMYLMEHREYLHYDLAGEALYAKELVRTQTLIAKEFYFATTLPTFDSPLVYAATYAVTGDLILSLKIGAMLLLFFLMLSLAYLLRSFGVTWQLTMLGILVFLGTKMYDSARLVGMVSAYYCASQAVYCIVLGYGIRVSIGQNGRVERWLYFIIPILAFMTGMNSVRLLFPLFLPIFIVCFLSYFARQEMHVILFEKFKYESLLWVVLSVIGFLYNFLIIKPRGFGPSVYNDTGSRILNYSAMLDGMEKLWMQFVHQTSLHFLSEKKSINTFSLNGIAGVSGVALFLLILSFSFPVINSYMHSIFRQAFLVMACGISLQASLSFLSGLFLIRYLFPLYMLFSIVCVLGFKKAQKINLRLYFLLEICVVAAILLGFAAGYGPEIRKWRQNEQSIKSSYDEIQRIIEIVNEAGMMRGYARDKDAAPLAVLSEGRLTIAPLWPSLNPQLWLTAGRNFKPLSQQREKTFLILRIADIERYKKGFRERMILDAAYDSITIGEYYLFLFNFNPFVIFELPSSPEPGASIFLLPEAAYMRKDNFAYNDTGRLVSDSASRAIMYGPFIFLRQGTYRIQFTYTIISGSESEIPGRVRVVDTDKSNYVSFNLSRENNGVAQAEMFLEKDTAGIEFSLSVNKGHKIELGGFKVTRVE